MLGAKLILAADLHRRLLRPAVGQPPHRRPHRAAVPAARAPRRSCSSATTSRRPPGRAGPGRRGRCCSPSSPGPACRSQWNEWMLFTHGVDFGVERPAVPHRHRLLRLPAAVPVLRGQLAVRRARHRPASSPPSPTTSTAASGCRPRGQRVTPQVKAHLSVLLGAPGPGQGGRLLAAALRAHVVHPGHRRRRQLHRRQRPAAGHQPAAAHRAAVASACSSSTSGAGAGCCRCWPSACGRFVAVVAGGIYPAFVQRFRVEPAESTKEGPYIARNIEATRAAMGLGRRSDPDRSTTTRTSPPQRLQDNADTVRNIRLLDPAVVADTFQQLQADPRLLPVNDVDVDRYEIDGETTQVVISARELNTAGCRRSRGRPSTSPTPTATALAMAPANAVTSDGRPDFVVGDIPVDSRATRPSTSTSPASTSARTSPGYSIVDTTQRRRSTTRTASGETVTTGYDGAGGVAIDSLAAPGGVRPALRRHQPADLELRHRRQSRSSTCATSRSGSQTLAPFLHFDADPYPVVLDGRIAVRPRRLHDHRPLPLRPAGRRRPAPAGQRPATTPSTTCATR